MLTKDNSLNIDGIDKVFNKGKAEMTKEELEITIKALKQIAKLNKYENI